jgi:hypothetical protein
VRPAHPQRLFLRETCQVMNQIRVLFWKVAQLLGERSRQVYLAAYWVFTSAWLFLWSQDLSAVDDYVFLSL